MMYEQNKLDKWSLEYINRNIYNVFEISFQNYEELGGSTVDGYRMGICKTYKSVNLLSCRCYISLDTGCIKMPDFFFNSVLWHEFCHAWCQVEIYENQRHRKEFKIRRRKKPLYWIGDMLLKWIGWIWVR